MKYRIEECEVCGIMNPILVIRGWADSTINHIKIKSPDEILVKEIKKIRSRIVSFDYKIPLKKHTVYKVYLCNDELDIKVKVVRSNFIKRVWQKYKPRGIFINKVFGIIYDPLKREIIKFNKGTLNMQNENEYNEWLKNNDRFVEVKNFNYQPKISIVMPVYNVPGKYLSYCIESILKQTYQNFEICIADDCSTNIDTIETLKAYKNKDNRIKVIFREENGHISRATNSALSLASGEFIGLMDNDDTLDPHALNEVVNILNEDKNIDFIYTDEDKIDMGGKRSDPHFKPDFSLDTLYGGNYICHFSVIRKNIIEKIGGFRVGYEGAQDFDLFLRVSNETDKIYHIPKILYHWRMIPGSTAVGGDGAKNYAGEAGKRALEDYFKQKAISVKIDNIISTQYFVEYIFENEPKVDILVVFEGNNTSLNNFLRSVYTDNAYKNFVVNIINKDNKPLKIDTNFNHSVKLFINEKNVIETVNNIIQASDGEYIIFANEYCNFETYDWINLMVGYAKQNEIGAVGCKVMDKNKIVRNAGVILSEQSLFINAYECTSRNDYGNYGRLLVPYNYSIVSSHLMCVSKEKIHNLDTDFNLDFSLYDLCLRLLEDGLRNVVLPQVEVINTAYKRSSDIEQEKIFQRKNKMHIGNDRYYNVNLSKEKAFRLKKI